MDVIIMSCDKNLDLISIMFECFDRFNVKKNFFDFYVVTETKEYIRKDVHSVLCNGSFSDRLKQALNYVDDYFLLLLDDFILESSIDYDVLNGILDYLKQSNCYCCELCHFKNSEKTNNELCNILPAKNCVCLQAGLWNKGGLLSVLHKNENAWETELFGTIRGKKSREKFLCLADDVSKPYNYNEGWLVVQGKWNIKEVKRLKENGVEINLGTRPYDTNFRGWKSQTILKRLIIKIRLIFWNIKVFF